ncbi:MAG: hypothetical protein Q4C65_06875 [Eubacteriales bacterium]|nr:hypothetical protein [Eubacteriales bacterium]
MATFDFNTLKTKYEGFHHPTVVIEVNDVSIGSARTDIPLSEIDVELTCGFEASAAEFSLYDVYDKATGSFLYDKVKQYLYLGSKVEIYLGYGKQVRSVFVGVITRVNFLYEALEIPCIRVTAMDVKGIMMSGSYSKQLKAVCFSEAVREVLGKTAYEKLRSSTVIRGIYVTDTPDKLRSGQAGSRTVEMTAESDYEFVVKAAKKYNYEFFTECGNVYFRKAKADKAILMTVGPSTGMRSFDVGYDLTGLSQTVIARGVDVAKGQLISASKKSANRISMGNRAAPLLTGSQRVYLDATITSREEAQDRADSLMEQISYRFGRLESELVGIPELLPGHFITLSGLGTGADNDFYVTRVRHVLRGDGTYATKLTGTAASLKTDAAGGLAGGTSAAGVASGLTSGLTSGLGR